MSVRPAKRIRITLGRPGTWYENLAGSEFDSTELTMFGYICDERTIEEKESRFTRKYFVNYQDCVLV